LSQLADQHREVFGAFLKPDFPFVGRDDMPMYFRDLQERLSRLLDDLAGAKDAINGAFDIYVSHMTHRTNQIIKLLTVVSTVLLPTTVVLAFFGTQFKSMPGLYSPTAFVVMVAIILAMTSGILLAFYRKGWL
jgi:magnesium transporter